MKVRLLHVDDNPAEAKLVALTATLEPDLEYVGALDCADDLIAEVEARNPDVVLMDMRMDGKDPLEAIQDLVQAYPRIRIVAYTGFDDPAVKAAALAAGAWGFVRKSMDLGATLTAICQAVRDNQPAPFIA